MQVQGCSMMQTWTPPLVRQVGIWSSIADSYLMGRMSLTLPDPRSRASMSIACLLARSFARSLGNERVGMHLLGLVGPISQIQASLPVCCLHAC